MPRNCHPSVLRSRLDRHPCGGFDPRRDTVCSLQPNTDELEPRACPVQSTVAKVAGGTLRVPVCAARLAGIDEARVRRLSPYEFRHSRTTEWVERSGNLPGVGYLLGPKHATTTNHRLHGNRAAAEAVLAASFGTNAGRAPLPTNEQALATSSQGLESSRCGREDSNLHGFYPTRSLV